jgi:hypothetical protein
LGIYEVQDSKGARTGNFSAAFALAPCDNCGDHTEQDHAATYCNNCSVDWFGSRLFVAMRLNMIQIPAMVAFQHGAGGMQHFLCLFIETYQEYPPWFGIEKISGLLDLR